VIPVRYHEAAAAELLTAVSYLEGRAERLGRRFLEEVGRAENQIAGFPQSAAEISPGIRKCLLRKFRYSLIYSVEGDGVIVLAVSHHSQAPHYWASRSVDEPGDLL
jgi:plasmid stabilization system protein ParE